MNSPATNNKYSTEALLYLAFEMGNSQWKLGFTIGLGQAPRRRTIAAGDLAQLREEIVQAKRRFGLREAVRVVSCYEAGRDGFWLHRYLVNEGIENIIVDSASLEVNRRKRRVKTDSGGFGKTGDDVDPLPQWGKESVARGTGAKRGPGGWTPITSGAIEPEKGTDPTHQSTALLSSPLCENIMGCPATSDRHG